MAKYGLLIYLTGVLDISNHYTLPVRILKEICKDLESSDGHADWVGVVRLNVRGGRRCYRRGRIASVDLRGVRPNMRECTS